MIRMSRLHRSAAKTLLLVVLFYLGGCASLHAEVRVALLIGNSKYEHINNLKNPRNDVYTLEKKLVYLGFKVVGGMRNGLNVTRDQQRELLEDFAIKIRGADIALFYYAGHGAQVNGINLLLPVDASLRAPNTIQTESLLLDDVLNVLNNAAVGARPAIVDACRDNSLNDSLLSGKGLSSIDAVKRPNTLVVFSASANNTADDGIGANSPFTGALVKHFGIPGADINQILRLTFLDVYSATGLRQLPVQFGSIQRDVVIGDRQAAATSTAIPEDSTWAAIHNIAVTTRKIRALLDFAHMYPTGKYTAEAQKNARDLIMDEVFSKAANQVLSKSISILWVDDLRENEFEKDLIAKLGRLQGTNVIFRDARSTQEAMAYMEQQKFDAIISDAGRTETVSDARRKDESMHPACAQVFKSADGNASNFAYSNQYGYCLLNRVRSKDLRTPYFIYSNSNEWTYKARIYSYSGQGSTNDPVELLSLVLSHLPQM